MGQLFYCSIFLFISIKQFIFEFIKTKLTLDPLDGTP